MTITVHRIIAIGTKTVRYQSKPSGPIMSTTLCSHHGCPDSFPSLNQAAVRYCDMLCQHHSKIALKANVFTNDIGETFISHDDPRYPGKRITIRTNRNCSIDKARIARKYCSEPEDPDRAKEIFDMIERDIAHRNGGHSSSTCCNSSCQTSVVAQGLYCL